MQKQSKPLIVISLLALLLAGLACNLPFRATQEDSNTSPVIAATQEPENESPATAQPGSAIQLTITEEQFTSLVAQQLQTQSDLPIRDIQVQLRDQQARITGLVERSGLDLPLTVVVLAYADTQGWPKTSIQQASIGPFSLPQENLNQVAEQLNLFLAAQLQADQIYIENITIADGLLTVTGRPR